MLMHADEPRRGDLDGRGSLTAAGLRDFCIFFLEVCIDQVDYMVSILDPSELLRRIRHYCEDETTRNAYQRAALICYANPCLREISSPARRIWLRGIKSVRHAWCWQSW